VALIKPQFEVGKGKVGKGGVVRDPALHLEVLSRLLRWGIDRGLSLGGLTPSPLLGDKGNREFLVLWRTPCE
jgi:23S rRNA (cytidine1920-2'-O)/16S rRNA (cytidine1409-2'-O)-methyltransferase